MGTSPLDDARSFDLATPALGNPAEDDAREVGAGFYAAFTFAVMGAAMAVAVPGVLTYSLKATELDPRNATTILSHIVTISSIFLIVGSPLSGRLSDRMTSRFGRRRPFLLLGALLISLGAFWMVSAGTASMMITAACLGTLGTAVMTVTCMAAIADQLPAHRRGVASAILGLGVPAGAVIGLWLAQLFPTELDAMILLPAGVATVSAIVFAIVLNDRPITEAERPDFSLRLLLSTFWVNPRRHPDYAWAWLSRLLVYLAVATVQAYQALYLLIHLHYTPQNLAHAIFLSTLMLTGVAVVAAAVLSQLSDRIGRRKPFVASAAVVFALGLLLAISAQSFGAFLIAMAVMGFGQGVYFAVDMALVTQVLPDTGDAAKDLGLMNLASNAPVLIVTSIGPSVLAIGATGNNFAALFALGAAAGVVGAVLILLIKRVR